MKSPFTRFRGGDKDKRRQGRLNMAAAQLRELAEAEKEINGMRDWCEGLLAAAATAANSAYEFAEALKELGSCVLQKAALGEDEEIGRVLLMLGKEQLAMKNQLNGYRGHVLQTISIPSESLCRELRIVEEMKQQCDEKRSLIDSMIAMSKEKRKSRNSNRESWSLEQLVSAEEELEQEINEVTFRLKSLKQGQCQILLTQAVRHHHAQLNLFHKGSKILESAETNVKLVAAEQHIECDFIALEDNESEEDDTTSVVSNDDSELSFDYGHMEKDEEVISNPKRKAEEILTPSQPASLRFKDAHRPVSQSAPIYSEKFDSAEKLKELHDSLTRKSQTYALPTPTHSGNLQLALSGAAPPQSRRTGRETQLRDSSSLEARNTTTISTVSYFSDTQLRFKDSVLKEHNRNTKATGISPPLTPMQPQIKSQLDSSSKKAMRHAFSGPLPNTAWSGNLSYSTTREEYNPASFTKTVQVRRQQTLKSPKMSPRASPPLTSSPKISELHPLPKPPLKPIKSSNISRHTAPLVSGKDTESNPARRLLVSFKPSPLPMPPGAMVRSFSIPSTSSSQRMSPTTGARLSEVQNRNMFEDVASPPLTPMALINIQPMQKTG